MTAPAPAPGECATGRAWGLRASLLEISSGLESRARCTARNMTRLAAGVQATATRDWRNCTGYPPLPLTTHYSAHGGDRRGDGLARESKRGVRLRAEAEA